MAVKLLCIGDIHLGRRPGRLPSDLFAEEGAALGPLAAWRRAVDEAIDRRVDAVLLAGDVVEQEDDFYEAFAPLEEGVRRLQDAGIAVLAVAGNHDVAVLPRLARVIDSFRLLGAGGRWEEATVEGEDGHR
ncbi:MAG: DNA repair exonuclease, partial [Deltaproteobacteria bacterium]